MTSNIAPRSAEILQFPTLRARRTSQPHPREFTGDAVSTAPVFESGFGGWYHEEAIAEEKRQREH